MGTLFFSIWESVKQGSVLDPMSLNIFISDLFSRVQRAKLHDHSDDNAMYYSLVDQAALGACVSHVVGKANWYYENGMLVSGEKRGQQS